MPTGDKAAAADPTVFDIDLLQPGSLLTLMDAIYITSTYLQIVIHQMTLKLTLDLGPQ